MKLFATMCNQPQRLLEALRPARAALVAQPPVARWGLGYVQSGEVLLARTPRPSSTPVDLFAALEGVKSDCVLGHAVGPAGPETEGRFGGTEDTPPYRYRRWMYVQDGPAMCGAAWEALASQVPEYLRRNVKGKGTAEISFHLLLSKLSDVGGIDDPNLSIAAARRAIAQATARIAEELAKAEVTTSLGNLAVSNSRSLMVARIATPLWIRRLHVVGERGGRDETFRGVLIVSGGSVEGEGFEDVPPNSIVTVTRDLRVEIASI